MESEEIQFRFPTQVLDDFGGQAKWGRFVSVIVLIIFILAAGFTIYKMIDTLPEIEDAGTIIGVSLLLGFLLIYIGSYVVLFRGSISLTRFIKSQNDHEFFRYTERIKWYYILSIISGLILIFTTLLS